MKKASILIVEDEFIVAKDIEVTLAKFGYNVSGKASSGDEAVKKTSKVKPDLVLMDINLKGNINGIEAAKKIAPLNIPVVFLTAFTDDEKLSNAQETGAIGYIVKPFDPNNLHTTIQMALQRHEKEKKLVSEKNNYKFLYERRKNINEEVSLDLYDRKILYELDLNSRASASSISKIIKLPKNTVNYRINNLIEKGYINRFYSIINSSKIGYNYYKIVFQLQRLPNHVEEEILDYLREYGQCTKFILTESDYNLVFFITSRSRKEVTDFVKGFSSRFGSFIIAKDVNIIQRTHRFNQRLLFEGKSSKISIDHSTEREVKFDDLDLNVLKMISMNARSKLIDLSSQLNAEPKVIKYRIKKMEKKGIINGYVTAINMSSIGRMFIQIDVSLKDFSKSASVIEYFNQTNTCLFAYELLGKYDLSFELFVLNDDMLNNIISKFRELFSNYYIYYQVFHVFREYVINVSPYN